VREPCHSDRLSIYRIYKNRETARDGKVYLPIAQNVSHWSTQHRGAFKAEQETSELLLSEMTGLFLRDSVSIDLAHGLGDHFEEEGEYGGNSCLGEHSGVERTVIVEYSLLK
jgi:hypothetical protein